MFQVKAPMLSLEIGHDEFTASNGWLEARQKRHGVKWAALCGEAAEVPADVVADWTVRLPDLTAGFRGHLQCRRNRALLPCPTRAIDGDLRQSTEGDQNFQGESHCAVGLPRIR